MSRYRPAPTPAQEAALAEHRRHARYVWNLAVEQHSGWKPGRKSPPGFAEQCRQLTEARAEYAWLRAGSIVVQQQALKDFAQAVTNFFGRTHKRPTWRRRGRHEGFRIVAVKADDLRRLSRHVGEVRVPKVGWVRFRWSRAVPGSGEAVGVDRGVTVSAALSSGEMTNAPVLRETEKFRLLRLLRMLARAKPGSNRRRKVKKAAAKLKAREKDRRKDGVEKTSTDLARRYDMIAVEDLNVSAMTRSARGGIEAPGRNVRQKAGLNRGILASGWGHLVERLEHKAPGRVVRVSPAFTSQTCNACKHVARESRESQALFRRVACGLQCNADVNAARNIRDLAAGHAVNARGGDRITGPVKREPQLVLLSARDEVESLPSGRGGCQVQVSTRLRHA
uniref:RNA-guided endonuclease InsQ/TnpB family protein n=1 Tax=Herbidospora sakaeratensis TaxID=564415 RepID=UPI000A9AE889|nr:RNA-guided endonuclease TnpB family protein [Herbidospora sakaeratensis]